MNGKEAPTLVELMPIAKLIFRQVKAWHWYGPFFTQSDIPFCVFRWREKAVPEISCAIETAVAHMELYEEWEVEVRNDDGGGIRILPVKARDCEQIQSWEEQRQAYHLLREDQLFMNRAVADFHNIIRAIGRIQEGFPDSS
jgi:hypothetical protein